MTNVLHDEVETFTLTLEDLNVYCQIFQRLFKLKPNSTDKLEEPFCDYV